MKMCPHDEYAEHCPRCKAESELAALRAEVAELRKSLEGQRDLTMVASCQRDNYKKRAEEAERKLAEVERNALERAAKVCEGVASGPSTMWEETGCWQHAAENCAHGIRALMKEPTK